MPQFLSNEIVVVSLLGYKTQHINFNDLKKSNFVIKLTPTTMNIDEIVISATRWRQNAGNQPSKITTVSAREVQLQNPQTAADLLNVSGKVFVQKSQQGGGSPMIRGFATNRLLFSVD